MPLTPEEVCTLLTNIKKKNSNLSEDHLFIEQAKALSASKIDNSYEFKNHISEDIRYYTEFTHCQLKGYACWRSRWLQKVLSDSRPYASYFCVYMAELINLIGCKDTKDALEKLLDIRNRLFNHTRKISVENKRAIRDFIVFYDLGSDLLYKELNNNEKKLLIFSSLSDFSDDKIFTITKGSMYKSWVYKQFPNLNKALIVKVLRAIDNYTRENYQENIAVFLFDAVETISSYVFFNGMPFIDTSDRQEINALPILRYKKASSDPSKNLWIEYRTVSDFIDELFPKIIKEIEYIIETVIHDPKENLQITLDANIVNLIKEISQNFFKESLSSKTETEEIKKLRPYIEYMLLLDTPHSYKFKNSTEAIKKAKEIGSNLKNSLDKETLFVTFAKILENVEEYTEPKLCFLQSFSTSSFPLRSVNCIKNYLYWRTCWRNGEYKQANKSFPLIYVSELINLIGCKSAEDAYEKLLNLKNNYKFENFEKEIIEPAITNFAKYYDLNKDYVDISYLDEFLDFEQVFLVLEDVLNKSDDEVFDALLREEENAIKSSAFYKTHPELFKSIIVRSLRQTEIYAQQQGKNSLLEIFFGDFRGTQQHPFKDLTFLQKTHNKKISLHPLVYYKFKNDRWFLFHFFPIDDYPVRYRWRWTYKYNYIDTNYSILSPTRFRAFLETLDAYARIETGFKQKKKPKLKDEWIKEIVKKAIEVMHSDKKQARLAAISFDISLLEGIRSKAEQTKEKLLTEEEKLNVQEKPLIKIVNTNIEKSESEAESITEGIDSLSKLEKRFLDCLLKNTPTNWIIKEGLTSSILCDSINEKLYTMFEDNVIENEALIEDYIDDLKESLSA